MRKVTPKVFLVGESKVCADGLHDYLDFLGADSWISDAPSDVELLPEFMGRLCYRSFEPGLNPNVTRVRAENKEYLQNILKSRHGSVLEHASLNFVFADVSRVFTHELVRHRVGVGISQESLRFVRLDNLGLWAPTCIREDAEAMEIMASTFEHLEGLQVELAKHFKLDDPDTPFSYKKEITSAMRRIAPIGLATTIGWTANIRTLRHVLEMRTHPSAEEEIRLVFGLVGSLCKERYPNLFGDYEVEDIGGYPHFTTEYGKV